MLSSSVHLSRALGSLAKGKARAVAGQPSLRTTPGPSRCFSSTSRWLDRPSGSVSSSSAPQPQAQQAARQAPAAGTTFLEPESAEPEATPTTDAPSRVARDTPLPSWPGPADGLPGRQHQTPSAFGQRVVIEDPRQLYKGPVERAELQAPLVHPPEHPFHFLPMKDKLRLDRDREIKLPRFPEPVKIPAYPQPIFKPSEPAEAVDPDAPPTLRYRDLPPENLVELYRERIAARPKTDRPNTWVQRMMDTITADPDDPKGWWLVREKMGLPPDNASRPAAVLWYWESLTEAQLWKLIMPLFYVWAAFPVVGASLFFAYIVWDGYFINPEDGSWQWTGRNWDRNTTLNWDNFTLRRDLTKFDRPPVVKV